MRANKCTQVKISRLIDLLHLYHCVNTHTNAGGLKTSEPGAFNVNNYLHNYLNDIDPIAKDKDKPVFSFNGFGLHPSHWHQIGVSGIFVIITISSRSFWFPRHQEIFTQIDLWKCKMKLQS